MTTAALPVAWQPRWPPLTAEAVIARRPAAERLLEKLLDADLGKTRLFGVASPQWLVITGPEEALPWTDGAIYLGRDDDAPALYLPTTRCPSAPAILFERALRRAAADLAPPLAVWPSDERLVVVSLAAARKLDPERLLAWRQSR